MMTPWHAEYALDSLPIILLMGQESTIQLYCIRYGPEVNVAISDVLVVVVEERSGAYVLIDLAFCMPRAAWIVGILWGEVDVGGLDDDLESFRPGPWKDAVESPIDLTSSAQKYSSGWGLGSGAITGWVL
ncbi:uncharacterized protein FTJAE_14166 [Fusarium tjaetaba]|uniref:Uncharacterized protein n=1 Tax=Fusarium tjaetaba TaxID=1567544 RepID=A0A8H5V5W7_9HYPO|nr:uncharacterized protein FTJAE_14166 [Fusarium tjaetaba]KAF5611761.1 hypothetical protein FTJAE_14166 [Fusarium tjaetaba]